VLLRQSGQHLDAVKAVRQDNIGSGLEACLSCEITSLASSGEAYR